MRKTAVIYWTGTGNTEKMANSVLEGAIAAGADADMFEVSAISPEEAKKYDVLLLGCPSMGDEVLEEGEFEPFFSAVESDLSGKIVGLFGSYGWGSGEWMKNWEERVCASGARLVGNRGIIANEEPGEAELQACCDLGHNAVSEGEKK